MIQDFPTLSDPGLLVFFSVPGMYHALSVFTHADPSVWTTLSPDFSLCYLNSQLPFRS